MQAPLQQLLRHPRIWRGRDQEGVGEATIATGYAELDRCLPGGGWPAAALTEIVVDQCGLGELRLLMPVLAHLSREDEARHLVWIAPPYIPYAPALAAAGVSLERVLVIDADDEGERLWAAEQALRSGSCAAVLLWVRGNERALRRLQLGAASGDCLAVVFRPSASLRQCSPAALRLHLRAAGGRVRLSLLKSRGGRPRSLDAAFLDRQRPGAFGATRAEPAAGVAAGRPPRS